MTEKEIIKVTDGEPVGANAKTAIRSRIVGWLAYLAVLAAVLFFVAPASWWQFGVSPANERKSTTNFTLKDINGGEWNFADQRGKVVVVNYWATWCPPCRVETPGLVNIANEYSSRGVVIVGVSVDENLGDVPPFVEKYSIPYRILLPGNDPYLNPEQMALPTTFLYDRNGRLAKRYTGMILESTLRSDIDDLLNEK